MSLIEPDDGQAMCAQGMESVVDCDFRGAKLMGSMWMSCSIHISNCPAKSNRGLAHSIFNITGRGWTTRPFWRSSVPASAKVKILCNIGVYLGCPPDAPPVG